MLALPVFSLFWDIAENSTKVQYGREKNVLRSVYSTCLRGGPTVGQKAIGDKSLSLLFLKSVHKRNPRTPLKSEANDELQPLGLRRQKRNTCASSLRGRRAERERRREECAGYAPPPLCSDLALRACDDGGFLRA